MSKVPTSYTKLPGYVFLLFSVSFFCLWANAQDSVLNTRLGKIAFEKYSTAYEDVSRSAPVSYIASHPQLFQPMDSLHYLDPLSCYWLKATIRNPTSNGQNLVLNFTNLSFVDLYLYQDTNLLKHKQAGFFRKKSDITAGDKRNYCSFSVEAKTSYTIFLKVQHVKYYKPQLHFTLSQKDAYLEMARGKSRLDFWLQGAVLIFAIYILLSWIISRSRPYAWLLVFIIGIGLYSIGINGYFTDWFFPEHPQFAWLFIIHFIHLGILGIYLLMMDFWRLKERSSQLYRMGKLFILLLVSISVVSFCINYFTSDFHLMNNINLWSYIFPFSFVSFTTYSCWRQLTHAQRYLAYGLILFLVAGLTTTLIAAILKERSFVLVSYITSSTIIGIVVLFSTGIKEELRRHEKDKHIALQKLNELQVQQNLQLETMVAQRTADLRASNTELAKQRQTLEDRNYKIETLINEMAHRVKNNLQLLYSLIKLQLPVVKDQAGQEILKGNISRIKAMMLVNEKLSHLEALTEINLKEFTKELTLHSTGIYDSARNVSIEIDIPDNLQLQGRRAISFGIILSELLTNSFKYAFKNQPLPVIAIIISRRDAKTFQCIYADNGCGIEEFFIQDDKHSMGLSLVKDLVRQLKGTIEIQNEDGLKYYFTVPV